MKGQTRFNEPEKRFYQCKGRNFSGRSASAPRPLTRRSFVEEYLKDNNVTPKKRLRVNNDGDDAARTPTAKLFSENVENSNEYCIKELQKHRKVKLHTQKKLPKVKFVVCLLLPWALNFITAKIIGFTVDV